MDLFEFTGYLNVVFGTLPQYLRRGQYAINVIFESYPDIYNKINPELILRSDLDPFSVDSRLNKFLIYLLDNHVERYKTETQPD